MTKKLNIIGCGNVGKTLGRLFSASGQVSINQIINRSPASSNKAIEFIGSGRTAKSFAELEFADFVLIASCDDSISHCCEALAENGESLKNSIVFHCSGAYSSEILAPARDKGALIASVHPIKSFASPELSVQNFNGTYCAIEGNDEATPLLENLFKAIGGVPIEVEANSKALYHGAAVFVCNYLTTLLDVGLRCYEASGISKEEASRIIKPFVNETIDNILNLGSENALTGPIARGELDIIKKHVKAFDQWDEPIANLYRQLGALTIDISKRKGVANEEDLAAIRDLLATTAQTSNSHLD